MDQDEANVERGVQWALHRVSMLEKRVHQLEMSAASGTSVFACETMQSGLI